MKISVICVGKIKEKYFRDAISEYEKRLSKYCKLEILEVADEKTPDKASETEKDYLKRAIAEVLGIQGKSHIQFIIGGSLGLHESVSKKADKAISFSNMTFPHQLMRVILLEQIYRSYRIIMGN